MHVAYICPKCDDESHSVLPAESTELECMHCRHRMTIPEESVVWEDGVAVQVKRCVCCPSKELYYRKDFPQRLGLAIIVVGFVLSSIAYFYHQKILTFGILFASAGLDLLIGYLVGNLIQCYRCHAEYRGVVEHENHEAFDLEIHERYRQQAARLEQSRDQVSPENS